jgi:hypothetical protein
MMNVCVIILFLYSEIIKSIVDVKIVNKLNHK